MSGNPFALKEIPRRFLEIVDPLFKDRYHQDIL